MDFPIEQYEAPQDHTLVRHTPIAIKLIGNCFDLYSSYLTRPFDDGFMSSLLNASKEVASQMKGFKLGYCFGEEVTFILTDYSGNPWLDGSLQDICSLAASKMTVEFNYLLSGWFPLGMKATFSAKVFQLPPTDIIQYLAWKTYMCHINSVCRFAEVQVSRKDMEGKNTLELEKLMASRGISWNHLASPKKYGTFFWNENNVRLSSLLASSAPTHELLEEIVYATIPVVFDK